MSQKTAVVTGGASGIGAAATALLRSQGWRVIPTGLTGEEVDAAGEEAVKLDVTDNEAVKNLFAKFDTLHGLVNSAGFSGLVEGKTQYEVDLFEKVIDINLTGTMRCSVAAFPALKAGQGAVVNLASILGYTALPHGPAYAASKAGVVNMTRAMGAQWAPEGVRVNAVAPGFIETPMTHVVQTDNARKQKVLDRTFMGRLGKPEEVAELIVWLLSDKASFVTGSTHLIDGGYTAS